MGKLSEAQNKLLKKVKERKDLWVEMLKKYGVDNFVDSISKLIAEELGIRVEEVRRKLVTTEAYKNYKDFASDPSKYVDIWISHIERAVKENKWLTKYIKAFYPE